MEFQRSIPVKKNVLNLTPLIDVIFLLIVFFLLTSEFIAVETIDLSITSAESNNSVNSNDFDGPILILLEKSGKFFFNDQLHYLSDLKEKLKIVVGNNTQRDFIIKTSDGVTVQSIVTAIDHVKAVGGKNISLAQGDG